MRLFARPIALVAVCGLAMLCTACGSNNKDKIVGKWKLTEAPGSDDKAKQEYAQLGKLGIYMYFDFKASNDLEMGIGSDKTETMDFFKAMAKGQAFSWTAKYKLLSGEGVEIYNLPKEMQEKGGVFGKNKDKSRVKIKIDGDNMSLTDSDGKTAKLVRVKNEPAPAAGTPDDKK